MKTIYKIKRTYRVGVRYSPVDYKTVDEAMEDAMSMAERTPRSERAKIEVVKIESIEDTVWRSSHNG